MQAKNKNTDASAKEPQKVPQIDVKEDSRAIKLREAPEEVLALAIREMMKK